MSEGLIFGRCSFGGPRRSAASTPGRRGPWGGGEFRVMAVMII